MFPVLSPPRLNSIVLFLWKISPHLKNTMKSKLEHFIIMSLISIRLFEWRLKSGFKSVKRIIDAYLVFCWVLRVSAYEGNFSNFSLKIKTHFMSSFFTVLIFGPWFMKCSRMLGTCADSILLNQMSYLRRILKNTTYNHGYGNWGLRNYSRIFHQWIHLEYIQIEMKTMH